MTARRLMLCFLGLVLTNSVPAFATDSIIGASGLVIGSSTQTHEQLEIFRSLCEAEGGMLREEILVFAHAQVDYIFGIEGETTEIESTTDWEIEWFCEQMETPPTCEGVASLEQAYTCCEEYGHTVGIEPEECRSEIDDACSLDPQRWPWCQVGTVDPLDDYFANSGRVRTPPTFDPTIPGD